MAILADLNDPRVQDVTVTYVEVAPDMRQAKVHVSVRGSETKQRLSLQGLKARPGICKLSWPAGSRRGTLPGLSLY